MPSATYPKSRRRGDLEKGWCRWLDMPRLVPLSPHKWDLGGYPRILANSNKEGLWRSSAPMPSVGYPRVHLNGGLGRDPYHCSALDTRQSLRERYGDGMWRNSLPMPGAAYPCISLSGG